MNNLSFGVSPLTMTVTDVLGPVKLSPQPVAAPKPAPTPAPKKGMDKKTMLLLGLGAAVVIYFMTRK